MARRTNTRLGKRASEILSNLFVLYIFGLFFLIGSKIELAPLIIGIGCLLHVFAFFGTAWIRNLSGQSGQVKFLRQRASEVSAFVIVYTVFVVGWFVHPELRPPLYSVILVPVFGAIFVYLAGISMDTKEK